MSAITKPQADIAHTALQPAISVLDRMLRRLGAPSWDESIEKWLEWIFDWPEDQAAAISQSSWETLSKVDPYEYWRGWTMDESLVNECKLLGLPCDPDYHEQPTQLRLFFTPPLSGNSLWDYAHDPDDPQRLLECLTPLLWLCWKNAVLGIGTRLEAEGIPAQERMRHAIPELQLIGIRLLLFTWPEAVTARLDSLKEMCRYMQHASDLFDLDSGVITNPDLAAARDFLANKGKP